MSVLGHHWIVELTGCDPAALAEVPRVERAMLDAAAAAGATVLGRQFHGFQPHGVSGFVVIAESHLSVHTWPEHGYAAVDLFTCGASVRADAAIAHLAAAFGGTPTVRELARGPGKG